MTFLAVVIQNSNSLRPLLPIKTHEKCVATQEYRFRFFGEEENGSGHFAKGEGNKNREIKNEIGK